MIRFAWQSKRYPIRVIYLSSTSGAWSAGASGSIMEQHRKERNENIQEIIKTKAIRKTL